MGERGVAPEGGLGKVNGLLFGSNLSLFTSLALLRLWQMYKEGAALGHSSTYTHEQLSLLSDKLIKQMPPYLPLTRQRGGGAEGGCERVIETREMTCVLDQFTPPALINKPAGRDKGEVSIKVVFPSFRDDWGLVSLAASSQRQSRERCEDLEPKDPKEGNKMLP